MRRGSLVRAVEASVVTLCLFVVTACGGGGGDGTTGPPADAGPETAGSDATAVTDARTDADGGGAAVADAIETDAVVAPDGEAVDVAEDTAEAADVADAVDVGPPLDREELARRLQWGASADEPAEERNLALLATIWGGEAGDGWTVEGETEVVFEDAGVVVRAGDLTVREVETAGSSFETREGALIEKTGEDECSLSVDAATLSVDGPGWDVATSLNVVASRSYEFAGEFPLEVRWQELLDEATPEITPARMDAMCGDQDLPFSDVRVLSIAEDRAREVFRSGRLDLSTVESSLVTGSFMAFGESVGCCPDGTVRTSRRDAVGMVLRVDVVQETGGSAECAWFEPSPSDETCGGACTPPDCREGFCDDGVDNDGDGATDCDDTDCAGADCGESCACGEDETCDDGLDNDGDDVSDCADTDCDGAACGEHGERCDVTSGGCVCPPPATETCGSGGDEDCDGLVDCADSDCEGQPCGANGLVCVSGTCRCGASTFGMELNCQDGVDDDCDGAVDCADPDCQGTPCGSAGSCHENRCESGACTLVTGEFDGRMCDDGDLCTTEDTCSEGICMPGEPVDCPEPPSCHTVRCEPTTGQCVDEAQPDGTACDDGNACTDNDACDMGLCVSHDVASPVPCCFDLGFRCEVLPMGGCAAAGVAAGGTVGTDPTPGNDTYCEPSACGCQPDEREPNESAAAASTIRLDADYHATVTGTICPLNDQDWYGLTVLAGDVLSATLDVAVAPGIEYAPGGVSWRWGPSADAMTRITEWTGTTWTLAPPTAGATPPGFVTWAALGSQDGTAYFSVAEDYDPIRTTLDVQVTRCPQDDHEPNDVSGDATSLGAGVTHAGLVVCGGEPDWYALDEVPAGGRLELGSEAHEVLVGQAPTLRYELRDGAGSLLSSGTLADGAIERWTNDGAARSDLRLMLTTAGEGAAATGNLRHGFRYDVLEPDCAREPWEAGAPPTGATGCPVEGVCGDGEDNDGNGQVDCADPRCDGRACDEYGKECTPEGTCACPRGEAPETACDDGVDNDCDGLVDCEDADCPIVVCCTDGGFACEVVPCAAECGPARGTIGSGTTCGADACPCPEDANEPDDSLAEATPLSFQGTTATASGSICPSVDWWSATGHAGDSFEVTITRDHGTVELWSIPWETERNGGSGFIGGPLETVSEGVWRGTLGPLRHDTFLDDFGGTIGFAAPYSGGQRWAYTMTVTVTPCDNDSYEPNQYSDQLAALALDQTVTLRICGDENDYFSLPDLPANTTARVVLQWDPATAPGTAFGFDLWAASPAGSLLATNGPQAPGDGTIDLTTQTYVGDHQGISLGVSATGLENPTYSLRVTYTPQ